MKRGLLKFIPLLLDEWLRKRNGSKLLIVEIEDQVKFLGVNDPVDSAIRGTARRKQSTIRTTEERDPTRPNPPPFPRPQTQHFKNHATLRHLKIGVNKPPNLQNLVLVAQRIVTKMVQDFNFLVRGRIGRERDDVSGTGVEDVGRKIGAVGVEVVWEVE